MKQAVLWAAFLWVVACGSELALAPFRRLQPFWSLVTALPPATARRQTAVILHSLRN
ncbi:MAG: hypothetical protein ACO3R5_03325 [Pseudohongiellaceae bacterium]